MVQAVLEVVGSMREAVRAEDTQVQGLRGEELEKMFVFQRI